MPASNFRDMVLPKVLDRLDRLDRDAVNNYLAGLLQELTITRHALATIQDAVIVCDSEGGILSANNAARRLLGMPTTLPPREPIAKYIRTLDWQQALASSEPLHTEFQIDYPQRRRVQLQLEKFSPAQHQDEERAAALLLILREVSLNLDSMRDLAAQERIQGVVSLAAGVAHEIGNPLNSLQIHLQLLKRQLPPPRGKKALSLHELLDTALSEIRRLDAILHQFLKAVRPAPPQLRPSALNALVTDTLHSMRPEIDSHDIILELDTASDLPAVLMDPDQIRQVLYNLIRNAIQASPNGAILHVSTHPTPRGAAIVIQDNGSGMTPEVMSRVFEPYFTTKESGNGLGLYIVRRIIQEHGGEIKVRSRPGQGTEITVELPSPSPTLRLAAHAT